MSSSPLSAILKENKLEGQNYVDWKRNLDTIISYHNYKFVLNTPCPPVPDVLASTIDKEDYVKWGKANMVTKFYMISSMSETLQCQYKAMETAAEIITSLDNLYGDLIQNVLLVALQNIMAKTKQKGISVGEHFVEMLSGLREVEFLGRHIYIATQISIILQSLSQSYHQFKLEYERNSDVYFFSKLLTELQAIEKGCTPDQILKELNESLSRSLKLKVEDKLESIFAGPKRTKSKKKRTKGGKCFKCGQKGN